MTVSWQQIYDLLESCERYEEHAGINVTWRKDDKVWATGNFLAPSEVILVRERDTHELLNFNAIADLSKNVKLITLSGRDALNLRACGTLMDGEDRYGTRRDSRISEDPGPV